jgi:hypothetical protein
MDAAPRSFDFSEERDAFIAALRLYAHASPHRVCVAGLSAVTRMAGAPPPAFEYVVVAAAALEDFVDRACNREKCEVLSAGCCCVAVGGKAAYLCTAATFAPLARAPVELLMVDVCGGAVEDLGGGAALADFDARAVRCRADPALRPAAYWKGFTVVSYLPGFALLSAGADPREVCGCVSGRPLYRGGAGAGGLTTVTFGGRVLNGALMESLGNVNFPIAELSRMALALFNADLFPGFAARHTADMGSLVANYEANMAALGLTDPVIGRFAALVKPLVAYAQSHPRETAQFIAANVAQGDFDGFAEVPTYNVSLDKCPLAVWFWSNRHQVPALLVFRAIDICCAYLRLCENPDLKRWLFVDAPGCWREAVALLKPPICTHRFSEISRHPWLAILQSSEFDVTQETLSDLFRSGGRFTPREMREELYSYVSSNANPTWAGFCTAFPRGGRGRSKG